MLINVKKTLLYSTKQSLLSPSTCISLLESKIVGSVATSSATKFWVSYNCIKKKFIFNKSSNNGKDMAGNRELFRLEGVKK